MLRIDFSDNRQAPVWLVDERFSIGQDSRNALVLDDAEISPFHAEIRQEQGYYYLSDSGSQAGTYVNDERIGARYQLRADDRVRLGQVVLLLVDPSKPRATPTAAPAARWFLQVIQGEHEGRKFHIHGSMTFGRSVKCELCFSDPQLSRRHCEFFLKGDVLEVKDLASAGGVRVNQQKVATALLQPGDQLRIGSVSLLVIGPRGTQAPVEGEDEDATQFMRAVDLPKPLKRQKPQGTPASANPLHRPVASPAATPAARPASRLGARALIGLALLAVAVALGGALLARALA
ncbi:FHA domain-containing protein [Pseudomonas zhanjiangensis]|uniref:FHA domain-containing protein n=1 Tax=Pseudomonas zhanjiangensis TaxID=3239015 RepID=A0ABV3YZ73_9PSED